MVKGFRHLPQPEVTYVLGTYIKKSSKEPYKVIVEARKLEHRYPHALKVKHRES